MLNALRDFARVHQLVVSVLGEPDRERLDLPVRLPRRHRRDDGARVDAAAQERADRHVADLVGGDRIGQHLAQLLDQLAFGGNLVGLELDVPVALDAQRRTALGHRKARRLELLHAVDDALRRRRRHEREQMAERLPVDRAIDLGQRENRLQLGRERDAAVDLRVVERLDAQAIAGQQQPLVPHVPDREREHAAQMVDAPRAVVLVEVDDRFGVAVGAERVAGAHELLVQLLVVVNLAVEHDADRAVLVEDRLLAAFEVDDAEPAHAERDAVVDVDALFVGTAVHHHAAHRADLVLDDGLIVPADDSGYAAHRF